MEKKDLFIVTPGKAARLIILLKMAVAMWHRLQRRFWTKNLSHGHLWFAWMMLICVQTLAN